jgi:hypothetical protein
MGAGALTAGGAPGAAVSAPKAHAVHIHSIAAATNALIVFVLLTRPLLQYSWLGSGHEKARL